MMSKVQLDMTIGHDYFACTGACFWCHQLHAGATVHGKHQAPGMLVRVSALPHPTAGGTGPGSSPQAGVGAEGDTGKGWLRGGRDEPVCSS